ncbi:MAG: GNAT family N-acetyltransferase [Bacteroidia bacterium]
MTNPLLYETNKATATDIDFHLNACKQSFVPNLDSYVNISNYANKIRENGNTFEAWFNGKLIGLVAAYYNEKKLSAFITNVSIEKDFEGKGIARQLLSDCKSFMQNKGALKIDLEIKPENTKAMEFYLRNGFAIVEKKENYKMCHKLKKRL